MATIKFGPARVPTSSEIKAFNTMEMAKVLSPDYDAITSTRESSGKRGATLPLYYQSEKPVATKKTYSMFLTCSSTKYFAAGEARPRDLGFHCNVEKKNSYSHSLGSDPLPVILWEPPNRLEIKEVRFGDIDKDGDVDVAVKLTDGAIYVFTNVSRK